MPRPCSLMQAVSFETSIVLLGEETFFLFNLETETWDERRQFRTGCVHFGLVLEDRQVYVIGGGYSELGEDDKITWTCRDDVRFVYLQNIIQDKPMKWQSHGKLPKPSFVYCYSKLTLLDPGLDELECVLL